MLKHVIKLNVNGFRIALLVAFLCVGACSKSESNDYCINHYQFHDAHIDDIGRLTVDLTSDGMLSRRLELPYGIVDGELPDEIFGLQTEIECTTVDVAVDSSSGGLVAKFESRCGEGNRLRQLDVSIFDQIPALEEIEVMMTTPVTQKRFVISRQCSAPIFRLD